MVETLAGIGKLGCNLFLQAIHKIDKSWTNLQLFIHLLTQISCPVRFFWNLVEYPQLAVRVLSAAAYLGAKPSISESGLKQIPQIVAKSRHQAKSLVPPPITTNSLSRRGNGSSSIGRTQKKDHRKSGHPSVTGTTTAGSCRCQTSFRFFAD